MIKIAPGNVCVCAFVCVVSDPIAYGWSDMSFLNTIAHNLKEINVKLYFI